MHYLLSSLKLLWVLILSVFSSGVLMAGIICPEDQAYHCSQVQFGIPEYPRASGTGSDIFLTITYIDDLYLNMCDEGYIERHWFIDRNSNGVIDNAEPTCVQLLTFSGTNNPVSIQWPKDLKLSCIDSDTDFGKPSFQGNSCDQISVNYEDEIFENTQAECYKILRHYNLWNSCANADGTMDSWSHTQVIKVIDEDAPVISSCGDKIIPLEGDCLATVTLEKSAEDVGDCPAQLLTWYVDIDLDLDGNIDISYGPNEPGEFHIPPTPSPGNIEITLPERLSRDIIHVDWKVHDQCGNYDACKEKISIEDVKPPTPYCVLPLYFKLNANHMDSLIIPASVYDKGGFDNCGGELHLSYSSNVEDTIKVIKCGQTGFQFDRIYFTDRAGNQDYCEVYSFVFDNGTCSSQGISLPIEIVQHGVADLPSSAMHLTSTFGESSHDIIMPNFNLDNVILYDDLEATIEIAAEPATVNIGDAIHISRYILGLDSLSRVAQYAADLNEDGAVDIKDLQLVKDIFLNNITLNDSWQVVYELNEESEIANRFPFYGHLDETLNIDYIQKANLDHYKANISSRNKQVVTFNYRIQDDGQVTIYNSGPFSTAGLSITIQDGQISDIPEGFASSTDGKKLMKLSNMDYAAEAFRFSIEPQSKNWDINNLILDIRDEKAAPVNYSLQPENHTETVKYRVVPNPVINDFYIQGLKADVEIEIFNSFGQRVPFTRSDDKVISSLNRGIYFIKIFDGKENSTLRFMQL